MSRLGIDPFSGARPGATSISSRIPCII
jgi:hypothetical protein